MTDAIRHRFSRTGVEAARESVIEQLSFLVDEIAAQKPLFLKISPPILSERPFGDQPSIKERYEDMLRREKGINADVITGIVTHKLTSFTVESEKAGPDEEELPTRSLDEIQTRISAMRQRNTDALRNASTDAWTATVIDNGTTRSMLEWAFKMALEDAETLREVTMQLSEIQHLFKR